MKTFAFPRTAILVAISIFALVLTAKAQDQNLAEKLSDYNYMLGDWTVTSFVPTQDGDWRKGNPGTASITTELGGTIITKRQTMQLPNGGTMTVMNVIGIDARTEELRMFTIDKEYGAMDIYKGTADGAAIKVSNLGHDVPFKTQDGGGISFRVSIEKESEDRHTLLVEGTMNEGKTWFPFVKNEYDRE